MAYSLTCHVCHSPFTHNFPHTTTCSKECRKQKQYLAFGYGRSNKDIPAGTVGAAAEMLIATDLMLKGYAVFRSLSPSCFCDLIACKDTKIIRIECRTAYRNQITGSVSFPKKIHEQADIYGLYIPSSKEIFYFEKDTKTEAEI